MTEGKQSDITREKVSYILVAQDLDNTNAMHLLSIHFTILKIKMINPYGGVGGYSGSFKFLYTAMQIKRKRKRK